MTLPAQVGYGTVTWTAVSAVADGGDADAQPDAVPVTGTLTFTPSATILLAAAVPVTVIATPVTYTLDSGGVLRDSQGRTGVTLVATDSIGVTPTGWTWSVAYKLNNGLSRGSFSFALPTGATVDLTTVAPVSASGGAAIVQGPAGPQGPPGPPGTTSSTLVDSTGKPVVSVRPGGGISLYGYAYPTWGYGGGTPNVNSSSPTLLDLAALGVPQMLWLPGTLGNSITTPDGPQWAGNVAGVPQTSTFVVDLVTNELDPIAGQSNYYLIAKPSCWLLRISELGVPTVKMFDTAGQITATCTLPLPVKQHVRMQVVFTPNVAGSWQCEFDLWDSVGQQWVQFGDVQIGTRAMGAYATTSGASAGILVGQNTADSAFRGGLLSAQVFFGNTLAGEVRPQNWTAGGTGGTDTVGNAWTINNKVPSNWVTQTCLAVGGGEYITLTGSPAGQQLTTPGLYSLLTLSGFRFDLSDQDTLIAYRDNNTIINTGAAPVVSTVGLYVRGGVLVTEDANAITQIGASAS